MEYDLNILKNLLDELLSRLNSLSVELPKPVYSDPYSSIELATCKLSECDKSDLMKDTSYQKLVADLNIYIQQEQFRLIRDSLNKNQNAVALMKLIADYITQFKNNADIRKADTLKQFDDYINNYPDMSYTEYLKCKNRQATQN